MVNSKFHEEQGSQGKADRKNRRKVGVKTDASIITLGFVIGIFLLFLGGGLVVIAMKVIEFFF